MWPIDATGHITSGPAGPKTTITSATGRFLYLANPSVAGTDSFSFTATDSTGLSSTPTPVSIAVAGPSGGAVTLAQTISEGGFVTFNLPGTVAPDNFSIVTNVSHGSLSRHNNHAVTYAAGAGFVGTDSFTYSYGVGHQIYGPLRVTILMLPN